MDARSWRLLRISTLLCAAVILCVLYIVVPVVLMLVSGTPSYSIGIGLDLAKRTVFLCILVLVFYFYQRALYDLIQTMVSHWITWSVLMLLPVALFGAGGVYRSLPSVRARQILGTAELAPLPESATEITVYTW